MDKKHYAFEFRCEEYLANKLRGYCLKKIISLNTLVDRVLVLVGDLHDSGSLCLSESSRFLKRKDLKDKKSVLLTLRAETREMVHNLAIIYRVSMAEVIRLGMEVYLALQEHGASKTDNIIHIYRVARNLPCAAVVFLYPALPGDKIPYPLII